MLSVYSIFSLVRISGADDLPMMRVGRLSMSQENLMEIFIDGLHEADQERFRGGDGTYLEIEEWEGVESNYLGEVKKVEWSGRFLEKCTVDMSWLPSTIEEFNMSSCKFAGTIDFLSLPQALEVLILSNNSLLGSVDLTDLPSKLRHLWLASNQLIGSLNLTQLPQSMQILSLSNNKFVGSIDLTRFPSSFEKLWIARNQLSGSLVLDKLPESMHTLNLSRNDFEGTIDLLHLPASLVNLDLSRNRISGEVSVLPRYGQNIYVSRNQISQLTYVKVEGGMGKLPFLNM